MAGGNYIDPEGGLYVRATDLQQKGIQTGEVKTHTSQSAAGLGVQGPVVQGQRAVDPIPHPKDPDAHDG